MHRRNRSDRSSPSAVSARLLTTARHLIAHPLPAALGVELIDIEYLLDDVSFIRRFFTSLAAVVLPGWLLDHWVLRRGGQKLDDRAAIVYTRGRTGPPKPVMLSHRNLVASVSALVKTLDPLPPRPATGHAAAQRLHRFRLRALGAASDRRVDRF